MQNTPQPLLRKYFIVCPERKTSHSTSKVLLGKQNSSIVAKHEPLRFLTGSFLKMFVMKRQPRCWEIHFVQYICLGILCFYEITVFDT